jgi:hypothetical protein
VWLEENRSNILSDNPDFSDEADIIKEGMIRFRVLSAEERKVRIILLGLRFLVHFLGLKNSERNDYFYFWKI